MPSSTWSAHQTCRAGTVPTSTSVLGCAVLRSSWPHGDSKPLLFAPHTWSALSWRQRRHCTRRGSVGAVPLSQAPLLSEAREVDSAGPNRQLVGLIRSRDPDVLPRRKHNRNPSGGAPCNPMKKSKNTFGSRCFGTCSRKGTFHGFLTKCYTFSLFQSGESEMQPQSRCKTAGKDLSGESVKLKH